ncbi:Protein BFR2 [Morella rubra]|uniref:Protein BFR2 n=1 Tax=Morella rubra TaxID=262757 RepID=A0A6A1WJU4_9ROSI|nr:Protein BFR2 [Morella rubra]
MNLSVEGDEDWSQVSQMHMRIAAFRNKSIDKWQRKTQVTTGAAAIKGKLHAFNQNISEQVAAYMRDPSRMIKQMQLTRSTVGIFGNGPAMESTAEREESQADGDPELLDDSEFYQQLLKEFFETIDPSSSDSAVYALKRSQTKKRKVVDRRASKSRKIREILKLKPLITDDKGMALAAS